MTTSRLAKLLYSQGQPCRTKKCKGTARANSYGQVESGLCLDCEVNTAYDTLTEANGSEIFGYIEDNPDESFVATITPRSQRRPEISDEHLLSESAKDRHFTRRSLAKAAKLRKLTILERQLGDHEYFKRDNYGYQERHETWRERSRHLVLRSRSIRQVLMRTYADAATRHGWVCGRYGDHECQAPVVIYSDERLGGNWRRGAERSKWYHDPAPRKTTTDLAICGAVSDHLDLSWTQPALRTRKDPRLSKKQLEAHRKEPQSEMPQMDQHYSFVEWLAALATLSKRSRKKYQMQRHGVAKVYTTATKKGSANWGHIQLA